DEKVENPEKEEKEEEKKDDKEEKKEDESKEVEEDSLDETELEHAKNLFKLLKNPETGRQALEALAKAAGLKIDSSVQEKKEIRKSIKEVLIEKLPNYKFLADDLGSALEEILNSEITNRTKDIRD